MVLTGVTAQENSDGGFAFNMVITLSIRKSRKFFDKLDNYFILKDGILRLKKHRLWSSWLVRHVVLYVATSFSEEPIS